MDQLELISLADLRATRQMKQFPSAMTSSQGSNLYKLILTTAYETELFLNAVNSIKKARDLTTIVSENPLNISTYFDLFTSPLQLKRSNRDYHTKINGKVVFPNDGKYQDDVLTDGFVDVHIESDASYYTGLFAHRNRRVSDGSIIDIANYVYAVSQLINPDVGLRILDDGSLIRYYNESEFTIEEGFNHPEDETVFLRQVFWIEFHKPNIVPIHIRRFYIGMHHLKPSGVCFLGAVFYCAPALSKNDAHADVIISIENDEILESGGVCCILPDHEMTGWDDEWGEFPWGGKIVSEKCTNSEYYLSLHLRDSQVDIDVLDVDYTYLHYARLPSIYSNVSALYYATLQESEPKVAGGTFFEEQGYNWYGYDDKDYSFYEKVPIEISQLHVVLHAGRAFPRINPFTRHELSDILSRYPILDYIPWNSESWNTFPWNGNIIDYLENLRLLDRADRENKINYSQKCFVTTSGYFRYIPWNSRSWNRFPWNVDFKDKLRDNESEIYITLLLYAPTLFVTDAWCAPHIMCPVYQRTPAIRHDVFTFVAEDYVVDYPLVGVDVNCECILFDNFSIPC